MKRAVVTGLGFTTSIGNSRPEVLQSLRDCRSGIEFMPELAASNDRVTLAGTVKGFSFPTPDPMDWTLPPSLNLSRQELRSMTPNTVFAIAAMEEAIHDAQLDVSLVSHPETGLHSASAGSTWLTHEVVNSLLTRGPMRTTASSIVTGLPNSLQLNLASHYAIKGASLGFSSACASTAHAIGHATDLIRTGRQEIVFVVGAEDCHPCTILPFAALRTLSSQRDPALAPCAFDIARDGFVIAGGATALVLENAEHAASRGANAYAEIKGWGQASDGRGIVAPDPAGDGLARAMTNALRDAALAPSDIDYINAHATATTAGDLAELCAIKSVFTGGRTPKVSSTKSLTGHGLSFAGALEAAICCLALREGFMPVSAKIRQLDPACEGVEIITRPLPGSPRVALSNSSAFGGANVALILVLPR